MATPDKSIRTAFQKGLQEIYKAMFQYVYIRFLDDSRTVTSSVYGETRRKVYKKPIKVLGYYKRERIIDRTLVPALVVNEREVIKIPVQEFIDNNIGYSTQDDIEKLRRIIIQLKGFTYQVDEVNPTTMIAGDFIVVSFVASPMRDYEPDKYDELIKGIDNNS